MAIRAKSIAPAIPTKAIAQNGPAFCATLGNDCAAYGARVRSASFSSFETVDTSLITAGSIRTRLTIAIAVSESRAPMLIAPLNMATSCSPDGGGGSGGACGAEGPRGCAFGVLSARSPCASARATSSGVAFNSRAISSGAVPAAAAALARCAKRRVSFF